MVHTLSLWMEQLSAKVVNFGGSEATEFGACCDTLTTLATPVTPVTPETQVTQEIRRWLGKLPRR